MKTAITLLAIIAISAGLVSYINKNAGISWTKVADMVQYGKNSVKLLKKKFNNKKEFENYFKEMMSDVEKVNDADLAVKMAENIITSSKKAEVQEFSNPDSSDEEESLDKNLEKIKTKKRIAKELIKQFNKILDKKISEGKEPKISTLLNFVKENSGTLNELLKEKAELNPVLKDLYYFAKATDSLEKKDFASAYEAISKIVDKSLRLIALTKLALNGENVKDNTVNSIMEAYKFIDKVNNDEIDEAKNTLKSFISLSEKMCKENKN